MNVYQKYWAAKVINIEKFVLIRSDVTKICENKVVTLQRLLEYCKNSLNFSLGI